MTPTCVTIKIFSLRIKMAQNTETEQNLNVHTTSNIEPLMKFKLHITKMYLRVEIKTSLHFHSSLL